MHQTLSDVSSTETSSASLQFQRLQTACDELQVDLKAEIRSAQDDLLAELKEQSSILKAIGHQKNDQKGTEKPQDHRKAYYLSLQTLPVQMESYVQVISNVSKSQEILRSLLVAEIGSREGQIHEAYEHTFDWIFDGGKGGKNHEQHRNVNAARARFKTWLRSSSEVFWINGKAGSGKSTLMKFLADHQRTQEVLRQWAGDENLVVAKHFFWNAGTKIQQSHIGLMQDLLYQILLKCPELIPFTSVERWDAGETSTRRSEVWTREELATSLRKIMERGKLNSRFCFFIDGLDEYADETAGEHYELIKYLDLLAQSPQVKLCVSSRPWTVFVDHYNGKEELTLVLQDLTSQDMYEYVKGMLGEDERFRRLEAREPEALGLVSRIRDKAEGVFFWVYLVVRSLLRGLSEHDDTVELERRLSEIPADLTDFFRKIFDNIDAFYRREAMRAFQLSAIAMPLPLMAFKYISKEVVNPRYALELTADELRVSDEKARDNVNKWCRDLLEVKDWTEVLFLHKTVKDFLLTHEMQAQFEEHPSCQSSPRRAMCTMLLADIKSTGVCGLDRDSDSFEQPGREMIGWALQCERIDAATPTDILDELSIIRKPMVEWWVRGLFTGRRPNNVLEHAVEMGLRTYVGHCLERDLKALTDILWYASPLNSNVTGDDCAMLNLLLEKGVDPNQRCPAFFRKSTGSLKTTWEHFLLVCHDDRSGRLRHWAPSWISHGACIDRKIAIGHNRLDVRTCLLTETGHWPGVAKAECERQVDAWLADARARRVAKPLAERSEPLKRPSLRAKLKSWLA